MNSVAKKNRKQLYEFLEVVLFPKDVVEALNSTASP